MILSAAPRFNLTWKSTDFGPNEQFERFLQLDFTFVPKSTELVRISVISPTTLLSKNFDRCIKFGRWAPAYAIWRAHDQAVKPFEGRDDFLGILLRDGVLTGTCSWYNDV